MTSTSYSEVSGTSSMADDFYEHLGLIFFLSQQVWSHRLWQVKDVQPASQQDGPNQCEEKHKRHRLCSCRIRNRNWSSSILDHWGGVSMQVFTCRSMAYTHLTVQTYDVSYPRDITDLGQGTYEQFRHGVLRKVMERATTSTWDISKTHVSLCSLVCTGLEFKLNRCRDRALVG